MSLPWWALLFFTIESALLRSKNPEWFNLYSTSKVLFIFLSAFVCVTLFLARKRIPIPTRCQLIWDNLSSHYLLFFLATASFCAVLLGQDSVVVGEDIAGQVKSSLQWIEGQVPSPNFLLRPNPNDLSENLLIWSLRPPGAAMLPVPGLLMGLSLGLSIKIALFFCSIAGGWGWLYLLRKLGICQHFLLIVSILLGLMAGKYSTYFFSANIILYAMLPWFLVWLSRLSDTLNIEAFKGKNLFKVGFFLFCLGSFCWVKLSGIIAAGTIGAALLILILLKLSKKLKVALVFLLLGSLFWVPFVGLEGLNHLFSGKTADQGYKKAASSAETPLTGEHWMGSTQGGWLLWSLAAAPGYALPTKSIAMGIRDLGTQFQSFRDWMYENEINAHVFLAGSLSILLTLLLIIELKSAFSMVDLHFKIIITCFCTLPFIGLAILSNRFHWNYLMFHSHTFEYWLVFIAPTLMILSKVKHVCFRTFCLSGIMLVFPICKNAQSLAGQFILTSNSSISETETARGLTKNRFSSAIQFIEEDSTSAHDILFFLPVGDSGDLVLRTKLRTLSTHFSGDNFPKSNYFTTSCTLHVYCAYDTSLTSNHAFTKALESRFPQAANHEIIYSDPETVTVTKIILVPKLNG